MKGLNGFGSGGGTNADEAVIGGPATSGCNTIVGVCELSGECVVEDGIGFEAGNGIGTETGACKGAGGIGKDVLNDRSSSSSAFGPKTAAILAMIVSVVGLPMLGTSFVKACRRRRVRSEGTEV